MDSVVYNDDERYSVSVRLCVELGEATGRDGQWCGGIGR